MRQRLQILLNSFDDAWSHRIESLTVGLDDVTDGEAAHQAQPLRTREIALRRIMPWVDSRLRYLDHIDRSQVIARYQTLPRLWMCGPRYYRLIN